MAELGHALAIVLAVNAMLWLGQIAVLNLNPDAPQFYNCEGSLIGQFEAQQCQNVSSYVLDDNNPLGRLPTQGTDVQVNTGSVFTDPFNVITNWFADVTGLTYLYSILSAPANFLKALSVPAEFAFALGAMWYGFTLFLIIAFIMGRDY